MFDSSTASPLESSSASTHSGRNVLIFVADGLRNGSVNPTDAPTLYSIRHNGVDFSNSHSLFPTFTTPNASAIATGHYLGDTGDFSNTVYAGYPVAPSGNSPTPFTENDPILGDIDAHFAGNFLDEDTLLAYARQHGYNTAAVGKLGPTLIQDVTQGNPGADGKVPTPQTIVIDDATGKTGGIPLNSDITQRLIEAGVGTTAPDRSNGQPAGTPLNNGNSGNNTTPGTQTANYVQQQYFTHAVTQAILPQFAQTHNPFAMVYWSRDPDGTQHNQGDSLNSLTPGINGPTSKAAIKNADHNLAQIIQSLKDQGLYDNTDIFVTSDHGFSTISRQATDNQGGKVNDYASTQSYQGVNPGFLPPGFVAIDLAHELGLPLYDADTLSSDGKSYAQVDPTQGQRPKFGDGLIGGTGTVPQANSAPDAKVVIAANGGSDLIYVPDKNPDTVKQIVEFLSKQDYTSGIFVDDAIGKIPGALPLSSINLKGSSKLPTPTIVLNFKTFATNPNDPVNSEVEIADTGLQQGQGMHGSFGRGDTFNNMAAIGPDFKSGYVDQAPVSNADITQTLAHVLGFELPSNGNLSGRVLNEAIQGGPNQITVKTGIQKSDPAANGQQTYLNYQQVGDTKYFDAAGFKDRTVGLSTDTPATSAPAGDTAPAPDRSTAGPDTGINSHGWFLTPAGKQLQLVDPKDPSLYGDRPYGIAISPNGKTLIVSNDGQSTQSLMVVDRTSGKILQTIPYKSPEALYVGVAFSPDGKQVFASAGGNNKIRVYNVEGQTLTETDPINLPVPKGADGKDVNLYPGGLTIAPDGKTLYVADNLSDSMSIVDLATRKVTGTVAVGHNPYTVALSKDGKTAYVSNWGEQTVSVVDLTGSTPKVSQTIQVGTHPNAMALNPNNSELYVTNADSDNVSVINTATNCVLRTIDLSPYPGAKEGSSPNAIAVSPDGKTLYVANATNNDIAVIQLGNGDGKTTPDQVKGLIPTAWFPAGLVLSPDGKQLDVINAKGLGAGPNPDGPNPYLNPDSQPNQYIGSMIRGSLSQIDVPDSKQLQQYTEQVVKNNGFDEGSKVRVPGNANEDVIPLRPGDPSPIKHIIYVIKENRTFDQVLGNLGKGNGDPALNLFGEESAPNQRELQRRFVTLDNFYSDSEVSADGWNWATGALANTYVQKNWPANYGDRNRPYDFEGGNYATSPGEDPTDAFIWNKLSDAGIDYRNYGFRVFNGKVAANADGKTTEPRLAQNTDLKFPGFDLTVADSSHKMFNSPTTRYDEWKKEFDNYVKNGNLPKVEFVRFPSDHTAGTKVGSPTPRAYMADNDYALGQLVDQVSHSPYWKDTAIFVLEDDAQNGPDHVDAHRTIAQVISPYTQTGKVDSTFYSTVSMLRTMELIAGIGPMSQYDAAATPMLNSFTDKPNFTPYKAVKPEQSTTEKNPVNAPLAQESGATNWAVEDQNEAVENQAIWKSIKGTNSDMPSPTTIFREADGEADATSESDS
jgi:YVTN family beta-propeller protein